MLEPPAWKATSIASAAVRRRALAGFLRRPEKGAAARELESPLPPPQRRRPRHHHFRRGRRRLWRHLPLSLLQAQPLAALGPDGGGRSSSPGRQCPSPERAGPDRVLQRLDAPADLRASHISSRRSSATGSAGASSRSSVACGRRARGPLRDEDLDPVRMLVPHLQRALVIHHRVQAAEMRPAPWWRRWTGSSAE